MNTALEKVSRFIATPRVSKHRLFVWLEAPSYPDCQLIVFARSDDYFFGVLHSRMHEIWSRAQGTQVRERESGFRYTPTTCFETFPFPTPTPEQERAIAEAAKSLDTRRNNWLNPPEWTREEILEFAGSVDGPWARYISDADSRGIGTVRYPRLVARDQPSAAQLARRTLTNLYNQRPTWLDLAHRRLDEAVFAAYGWDATISDEEILARLLALNLEREPAKGSAKE
ncbi:MAG: type IIL restriction-modification enzyme MmeI [Acidobacteriota bacterium]